MTMPHNRITEVKIIQNINIWRRYQLECDQMQQKLGRTPTKMFLWHGSSTTDPNLIISSQEGFDMRFGNPDCMWGKAVYFAKNASYSQSYAYKTINNCKQMFLAEVLIGETVQLP
jgi:hypothetical protein